MGRWPNKWVNQESRDQTVQIKMNQNIEYANGNRFDWILQDRDVEFRKFWDFC